MCKYIHDCDFTIIHRYLETISEEKDKRDAILSSTFIEEPAIKLLIADFLNGIPNSTALLNTEFTLDYDHRSFMNFSLKTSNDIDPIEFTLTFAIAIKGILMAVDTDCDMMDMQIRWDGSVTLEGVENVKVTFGWNCREFDPPPSYLDPDYEGGVHLVIIPTELDDTVNINITTELLLSIYGKNEDDGGAEDI